MEIEEAVEQVRLWLGNQPWWSDETDTITSVVRTTGSWTINHMPRRYLDTDERVLGGYGPVIVTDDGGIIPPEPPVEIDHVDESGIATLVARTLKKPRPST